ncbi:uncharacterized protein ARMOST_12407 [Armillaria ostoyae]|uniref:Uncharacterized protein n=1 Tax=Armillaria ostoyae TaxID=47428 RepID=A0A284RJU2_ARMOS|nr:uncharacterized protein ARMOST_12407 [Armillaria ostoyae]
MSCKYRARLRKLNISQSTVAKKLSQLLDISHVSLDSLFWRPNWEQTPDAEFKALVSKAMNNNPNGWIIDGNYQSHIGKLVQNTATDIIWLDPPFLLYFPLQAVKSPSGRFFSRVTAFCAGVGRVIEVIANAAETAWKKSGLE